MKSSLQCKARVRMILVEMITQLHTWRGNRGLFLIVICLCVCVLSQMLGMPVTLGSLLCSSDMLSQPTAEEFSLLPEPPRLDDRSRPCLLTEVQPSPRVPVFVSSVFHPPIL
jgi:hypothetical protein